MEFEQLDVKTIFHHDHLEKETLMI